MGAVWTYVGWLAGASAVLMLVAWLVAARGSVRTKPGWLVGVVGLRGGGKSLFVARLIAMRLRQGRPVAANFHVPGAFYVRDWQDCMKLPRKSLLIIDEFHQWAPTTGKLAPTLGNWYVSHIRKLDHEVYWIAQHESQIASFAKNQTNEMVICQQMWKGHHRASSFAPHEFRKRDVKPIWRWWYQPKGAAIRVFKTGELMRPTTAAPMSLDEANVIINRFIDAYEAGTDFSADLELTPPMPASERRRSRRRQAVTVPVVALDPDDETQPSADRGAASAQNARSRITTDFPTYGDPAPSCDAERIR